jgi:hypothetical protein
MSTAVECPKCVLRSTASRWHATGRFSTSRHGLRRAELVCGVCGYVFSSGRAEAIAAGEAVAAAAPPPPPPAPTKQPTLPHAAVRQPSDLTPVGAIARDFKKLQAGDE